MTRMFALALCLLAAPAMALETNPQQMSAPPAPKVKSIEPAPIVQPPKPETPAVAPASHTAALPPDPAANVTITHGQFMQILDAAQEQGVAACKAQSVSSALQDIDKQAKADKRP